VRARNEQPVRGKRGELGADALEIGIAQIEPDARPASKRRDDALERLAQERQLLGPRARRDLVQLDLARAGRRERGRLLADDLRDLMQTSRRPP
jgi:hypothetical protein